MQTQDAGTIVMTERKRVALIAHDNCKGDLLDWARFNQGTLGLHELFATGRAGGCSRRLGLKVTRFLSGPLGGISRWARPSWKAGSIS